MALTIDLSPDVEARLHAEAAKRGIDPSGYVVNTLKTLLDENQEAVPQIAGLEAELMQKINQGLPQETWRRYQELIQKRDDETLTPDEHSHLIEISDRIEEANAARIESLVQLAQLKHLPLSTLMQQLGISPSSDA